MDSELYGNGPFGAQVPSNVHLSSDGMPRGAFASDGSGYGSHATQSPTGYQSSPYMTSFRQSPALYDAGQGSYPNTIYPESSQRTGSNTTTSLGLAQDAGTMNRLSNFGSNHYEATFDFDTPQLSGAASGNGSMFDRYGPSSLRNTSISDHRTPPSPPTLSGTPISRSHPLNTHVHSHSSTPSTNTNPLYSPAMSSPPHPMTSYSRISSSSNTSPSSLFPKVHPPNLSNGPGFDIPPSSPEVNFAYGDPAQTHSQHRRHPHIINTPNGTPSMSPSIPMSTNAPVNWNSGHSHEAINDVLRPRAYSSSLSSSSATTPTLPATMLGGGDSGRLLSAAGASAIALSRRAPYGSVRGTSTSTSVTPPLDTSNADPGSKAEANGIIPPPSSGRNSESVLGLLRASKDGQSPAPSLQRKQASTTPSNARSIAQEASDNGPDGHLQPPMKKKKKSKMHTCEICSKKFPRPSGLRTHMNTHNNARPYACGFPGCTRTFGVRSNAKRHLRTHGIIPPPSNASNNGEGTYVVGFSPPVIAPTPAGSAGFASDGSFAADGTAMVDGELKPKVGRTPFFKLRWMPPSLTSRSNAAKLKPVDEVTGEVSEEDTESEEGEEEGDGSDRDRDDRSGGGLEDERDSGPEALDATNSSMLPPSLGGISMPSLMGMGGSATVNGSLSSNAMPPAGPSRASSYSSLYSMSSTSTSNSTNTTSSHQGCICPFSPCLSDPCRTLNSVSSYNSSPAMDHSTIPLGPYAQTSALRSMSMPDFTMGSLNIIGSAALGSLSISSSSSSPPSSSMDLGFGAIFGSSGMSIGASSLYARRVANAMHGGHHAHLLASA